MYLRPSPGDDCPRGSHPESDRVKGCSEILRSRWSPSLARRTSCTTRRFEFNRTRGVSPSFRMPWASSGTVWTFVRIRALLSSELVFSSLSRLPAGSTSPTLEPFRSSAASMALCDPLTSYASRTLRASNASNASHGDTNIFPDWKKYHVRWAPAPPSL